MENRFITVSEPTFQCCKPPFSFYEFISQYWPGTGAKRTLHRIFSLMRKMRARTVVVEKLKRNGELDIEASAVEKRCGGKVRFTAWRFSFFACPVTSELLAYATDSDYLGYAVFLDLTLPDNGTSRYIYESVITEPRFHGNTDCEFAGALPAHYLHSVRSYSGWIGKHRFRLVGSFFSQQNNLTHVCAHAALRWLLNNLPERVEETVSYEDINRDLGIDHLNEKVGKYGADIQALGLPMDKLLDVLRKRNYQFIDVDFESDCGRPQPYWRFIYSIIEAGYPALIFFTASQARHVICAIGHTLNSDIWDAEAKLAYSGAPRARYLSTSSWVDHFIIHDDNYGMYFCMPAKALSPLTDNKGPFQVTGALGVVPTEIQLGPLEAESYASLCLHLALTLPKRVLRDCHWLHAMQEEDAAFGKWLVLRTLFTDKAAYKKHLSSMEDPQGNILGARDIETIIPRNTPEHFWITEVTLADIYTANKRKLGEVLFRLSDPQIESSDSPADYTRKLLDACISIRVAGNIVVPNVNGTEITFDTRKTDLTGHVPLLRTRRAAPLLEW